MDTALLEGTRVVELASSIAAAYCGKVLAELGADVIKLEAPGVGAPTRAYGPFVGAVPDPERSAGYIYVHTGKRSVTIDRAAPLGQSLISRLIADADVTLIDRVPDSADEFPCPGTTVEFVGTAHPEHQHFVVSDLVGYALSGYLYVDGSGEREPLKGGGRQPAHTASNYAILALLAQRFGDDGRRSGRRIVVPEVESMATMHWYTTVMWTYARIKKQRIGNRLDLSHPVSLYPCRDGWVAIGAGGNDAWRLLALVMERPELADDPRFADGASRLQRADEVDAFIKEYTSLRTREDVMSTLQGLRVACGFVSTPHDLLVDPQYGAREYWQMLDQPGLGQLATPGAPFKDAELEFQARPAPRLGQHTADVLQTLGISAEDQRHMRWDHVI